MTRGSRLEFVVAAIDELPQLRSTWDAWTRRAPISPFAFPAFFEAWCQAYGAERTGFLAVGLDRRSIEFVLPLWHPKGKPHEWSTLGAFHADYSEAVASSEDPEIGSSFWRWLTARAPCSLAKIARLPADSLLGASIPNAAFDRRGRISTAASTLLTSRKVRYLTALFHEEHPYADRAQNEELATRLDRAATRRNVKMLEKSGVVSYETVHGSRELRALLPTLFDMHVSNFEGTGRSSQFARAEERIFYEALVASPDLERVVYMDVLRVAQRPVAIHLGFQHAGTIYYSKPTFDLELAKASPGKSLLAHLFVRAKEQKVQRVDLLKGTEPYKAEWANQTRRTVTTSLVQRGLRDLVRTMVQR